MADWFEDNAPQGQGQDWFASNAPDTPAVDEPPNWFADNASDEFKASPSFREFVGLGPSKPTPVETPVQPPGWIELSFDTGEPPSFAEFMTTPPAVLPPIPHEAGESTIEKIDRSAGNVLRGAVNSAAVPLFAAAPPAIIGTLPEMGKDIIHQVDTAINAEPGSAQQLEAAGTAGLELGSLFLGGRHIFKSFRELPTIPVRQSNVPVADTAAVGSVEQGAPAQRSPGVGATNESAPSTAVAADVGRPVDSALDAAGVGEGIPTVLADLEARYGAPDPALRAAEKARGGTIPPAAAPAPAPLKAARWTRATAEAPPKPIEPVRTPQQPPPMQLSAGVPIPEFSIRRVTQLDDVTANRSSTLQRSSLETRMAQHDLRREVPSRAKREAIAVFLEANGDHSILADWQFRAKSKWMRNAAAEAQKLTPKEIATAADVRAAYDLMEQRGNANGVLSNHRDNYITHVWNVKNPAKGFGTRTLKQKFAFNKARTLNTFFDGDQAGLKPKTMDVADLLPGYIAEMNRVIADRQFVDSLVGTFDKDGNPNVIPRGRVGTVVDPDGNPTFLSNPRAQNLAFDKAGNPVDQSRYRVMEDQPALRRWAWKAQDAEGNPIMQQGDLALSPSAYRRVKAMMGESKIRQAYRNAEGSMRIPAAIVRAIDVSQSALKREMFGLLPAFHMVQEGWHGIGHAVNPVFGLLKLEDSPQLRDAMKYTMILPDKTAGRQYFEGVGAHQTLLTQATRKFGGRAGEAVANVIDGYQRWTFESYIPRLKYTTYAHILDRNLKRFAGEIRKGEVSVEDVKLLSGQQTDAAYGHLNYSMLDRDPTFQHILQLSLLAPDFLEARGKFAAQAGKAISSKTGNEQFIAIARLAAVQAAGAYTLAQLTGGQWEGKHPFEFVLNGRRYTLRSVPEDLQRLFTDTRPFVSGRINPTLQTGIQLLEGLNYRGEKVSTMDTLGEYLGKYIPITARSLPGVRELTESTRNSPVTPMEQFAGSMGIKISRYSPVNEVYKLSGDWMDKQGIAKDRGSYPVSKYQQLRYALEDGDLPRARMEYSKLKAAGESPEKIAFGFKASVNHAFTGSQETDAKFRASLSDEQKELYEQAVKSREGILNKFEVVNESQGKVPTSHSLLNTRHHHSLLGTKPKKAFGR